MYLFCISCKQIVATIEVPTLVLSNKLMDKYKKQNNGEGDNPFLQSGRMIEWRW